LIGKPIGEEKYLLMGFPIRTFWNDRVTSFFIENIYIEYNNVFDYF